MGTSTFWLAHLLVSCRREELSQNPLSSFLSRDRGFGFKVSHLWEQGCLLLRTQDTVVQSVTLWALACEHWLHCVGQPLPSQIVELPARAHSLPVSLRLHFPPKLPSGKDHSQVWGSFILISSPWTPGSPWRSLREGVLWPCWKDAAHRLSGTDRGTGIRTWFSSLLWWHLLFKDICI